MRDPDVHLVTLIGPGGIGKTRLAIEVATDDEPRPTWHAVSFIDLAAVLDAAGWPEAVTAVLGIRPEGTRPVLDLLIDRLQGLRLLLVLDNVEQLVAAASDLGTLLAACPDLTVLVTSRIVLRLRGEHEVALAPLPIPSADPRAIPDHRAVGRRAAAGRPRPAGTPGLRRDPGQRRRGGRAVPPAGRHSAGPGAGRRPAAPADPGDAAAPPRHRAGPPWTWPPARSIRPTGSGRCVPRSSGATAS